MFSSKSNQILTRQGLIKMHFAILLLEKKFSGIHRSVCLLPCSYICGIFVNAALGMEMKATKKGFGVTLNLRVNCATHHHMSNSDEKVKQVGCDNVP